MAKAVHSTIVLQAGEVFEEHNISAGVGVHTKIYLVAENDAVLDSGQHGSAFLARIRSMSEFELGSSDVDVVSLLKLALYLEVLHADRVQFVTRSRRNNVSQLLVQIEANDQVVIQTETPRKAVVDSSGLGYLVQTSVGGKYHQEIEVVAELY